MLYQVQYNLKEKLDDHPFWRTKDNQDAMLTISEMIKEILCFKNIWDEFKLTEEYNNKLELIKEQLKNIRIDFFVSVQIEEVMAIRKFWCFLSSYLMYICPMS